MRKQFSALSLARRMGRYYRRPFLLLEAVVFLLSGAFGAVAITHASIKKAAKDGIAEQTGHLHDIVQPATADAATTGTKISGWFPALDVSAEISHSNALVEAPVRIYAHQELKFGRLIEGHRPAEPGQVLITKSVAEALTVSPGQTVTVTGTQRGPSAHTVTGIVVDSGNRSAEQGYLLGDVGAHPNLFLTNTDPVENEATARLFEDSKYTYTTQREAARSAAEDSVVELAPGFRTGLFVLGSALAVLLPVAVWVLVRAVAPALRALAATGMSRRGQLKIIMWLVGASTGIAAFSAMVAAGLVLWITKPLLSALFDQQWAGIALNAAVVVLPVASTIAAVGFGAAVAVVRPTKTWRSKFNSISTDQPRAALAFCCLFLILAVALTWAAAKSWVSPEIALPILFLAVVSLTWVTSALLRSRLLPPALRKATHPAGIVVVAASVLVSLILTNVVVFAARAVHEHRTAVADDVRTIPAGSMAIDSVPSAQALQLAESYHKYGGEASRSFTLPLEDQQQLRIISAETADCLREHGSRLVADVVDLCGLVPLEMYVVFDENLAADEVVVAPEYEAHGSAYFVVYQVDLDEVSRIQKIEKVRVDASLAVPLAGAVVSKNWPLSEELALNPSDLRQVVFEGFSQLSSREQAEFRMLVRKLAPAAESAEIRDAQEFDQTELVVTLSVIVGGLLALLILFATALAMSALREVRGQMQLFGSSASLKRRLTATVFLQWAIVGLTSVGGGLLIAWLVGAKDGLGFGLLWGIPVLFVGPAIIAAWRYWAGNFVSDES